MTLADARNLRDEIREYGLHCTVPLGYGAGAYTLDLPTKTENLGRQRWQRPQRN